MLSYSKHYGLNVQCHIYRPRKKTPVVQEENVMEYYEEEYIYLNCKSCKI